MPRKKIKISKKQLEYLYYQKKMSLQDIEKLIGYCRTTISTKLKEHGLKIRERGSWQTKYKKQDFSGTEIEKSYLLGFRIGDLNVYVPYKKSKIIVARCHTTRRDQIELMEEIFQKYGQIVISKSRSADGKISFHIGCNLNRSFSFLVISKPYRIDDWIKKEFNNATAFISGYTDAEGNFIINQNRARFKIDSYDFYILNWMHKWFREHGIKSKFRLIKNYGAVKKGNKKILRKDLWRLNINEAYSLFRFCSFMLEFSKHKKRTKDMLKCLLNIVKRKENETI